ncbi:MAG: ABC transporter substrate-binding protein [Atopobiaceae bacterium]|jgi:peptide/nickel transport system substrate-binding protein|nr:ABC transporter substrate-binding protein [Atopobiaceae bacterium]MCH4180762.1 ABC transporter substrate-binding protein [Atopobiaceae bacterium]MCH4214473.1 ABC transporter substrate-binding protein [Atopobiaceae bacterium]MCH4229403.1 ABC transporter substrate-binding protein [Atopobiaceae bacterium]MCH4276639.1 ABC transporter substrate-binding protein [Atopobiaceae bacterium]
MDQTTMSRRKFVELFGAVCATGSAALFTSGCGSTRASDTTTSSTSSDLADTITFAQGSDPRGLDPAYVDDGESAKIMCNIYDTLLRYDKTNCDILPGLASEYKVSDDGLTYTLTLHSGVKFHDGTDCNAAACKSSIERQLEGSRNDDMPYASFVFGTASEGNGVSKVEAPDDTTLVITLVAASTPFLKNLAMALAAPIVSPTAVEKAGGNINEAPCGTGPYTFVSWTKSQNVVLKANDSYWDTDNAPKTPNIIFKFISENASRVTALNNGEADIIDGIDDSVVQTITDAGNSLYDEDGMNINYMAFNTTSDTFKTAEARKAFAKAVNVEEMVSSLYGDYASVATSIMPLWMAPYDSAVSQTAYDADAAKTELAAAGVTSVKCITYSNSRPYNTKGGQVLAEAIQGYLKKVGVEVTIDTYDWTTYKTKVQTEAYDICFYGWVGDNGDPDNFMNLLADSNVSMNVARFDDADYKALIAKGVATPDGDDRNDVYLQCEQMAAEKQPWLLISHSKNLAGYNPKVKDFVIHPTGDVWMWGATKTK